MQSCIGHVGFPDSLAGIKAVLDGDDDTDMEKLLWPPEGRTGGGWTAPRWLTAGDIIFFYHSKKAEQRITRLLKASADPDNIEWQAVPDPEAAIERLGDQLEIARRYAGTIFGCALVTGSASYWRNDDTERDQDRHWRSNIYAPISREHIFARPLPDAAFRSALTLSPGGAITPLHGPAFEGLKMLLAEKNQLPDYLVNAQPGGVSFRDVDATNWIEICCAPTARFIDESQLRAYLLDYLLQDLKDPRTTVYEECRCGLGMSRLGFADYFVQIHGRWLPVEAKLNVRAERNLPGQVSKYVAVNEFVPSRGKRAGELIRGACTATCLVVDAVGIYLVNAGGYVGCAADRPLWHLTELTRALIPKIREQLRLVL